MSFPTLHYHQSLRLWIHSFHIKSSWWQCLSNKAITAFLLSTQFSYWAQGLFIPCQHLSSHSVNLIAEFAIASETFSNSRYAHWEYGSDLIADVRKNHDKYDCSKFRSSSAHVAIWCRCGRRSESRISTSHFTSSFRCTLPFYANPTTNTTYERTQRRKRMESFNTILYHWTCWNNDITTPLLQNSQNKFTKRWLFVSRWNLRYMLLWSILGLLRIGTSEHL